MSKSLTAKAIQMLEGEIKKHIGRYCLTTPPNEITDSYEISLRFDQARALLRYIKKLEGEILGEWQAVPHRPPVIRSGGAIWSGWVDAGRSPRKRSGRGLPRRPPASMKAWMTKRRVKRGRR